MQRCLNPVEGLLPSNGWWRRESLLVAASGGLDSTVLLDLLHRRCATGRDGDPPIRLGAAYLDHGWRGKEGSLDAALVADLCARRRIPFFAGAADVDALRRASRRSPEAAGREARYRFLAEIARRESYAAVATAHHADDQLETLLWRLERGGREEGLAGILPVTRIAGVEVVRPLLGTSREALLAYAEERRLPFREDATNSDVRFPRNRLRQFASARLSRAEATALVRLAALRRRLIEAVAARAEESFMTEAEGSSIVDEDGHLRLPLERVARLPSELRREILRRTFHRLASPRESLSERALDQLERLLGSSAGARASLPGVRAHVSCGWLLLERESGSVPAVLPRAFELNGELSADFDPADLEGPLVVRSWAAGDRIDIRRRAAGGASDPAAFGRKKVKEVFREARVPAWERERYPVAADDRGVLWVVGLRRGARAMPKPGRRVVRLRVRPIAAPHASERSPEPCFAWTVETDAVGESPPA